MRACRVYLPQPPRYGGHWRSPASRVAFLFGRGVARLFRMCSVCGESSRPFAACGVWCVNSEREIGRTCQTAQNRAEFLSLSKSHYTHLRSLKRRRGPAPRCPVSGVPSLVTIFNGQRSTQAPACASTWGPNSASLVSRISSRSNSQGRYTSGRVSHDDVAYYSNANRATPSLDRVHTYHATMIQIQYTAPALIKSRASSPKAQRRCLFPLSLTYLCCTTMYVLCGRRRSRSNRLRIGQRRDDDEVRP